MLIVLACIPVVAVLYGGVWSLTDGKTWWEVLGGGVITVLAMFALAVLVATLGRIG